jgi:Divergent InlB B-repeat domain
LVLVVCLAAAASASAAPPVNDSFASPTPITLGSTVSATNVEATKESGEPDHAGNAGGHSVWFSWTASRTETVGLSTPCFLSSSSFEPLIAVYTGSAVNALTPVASNANLPSASCSPFSESPEVEFEAQSGTEYRIAVDGKNGGDGSFELKLAGAPANDEFAAATTVPAEPTQPIPGTTRLATEQPGEPDHAGDADGHSVWFNWTPAHSEPVIVSTCGPFSDLDAVLAVYTGSAVGALTEVASDDDGLDPGEFPECRGTDSEVRLAAIAGTTYRIAIDGTSGTVGRFSLRIHGHPANDSFATPQVLGPSRNAGTGLTNNKLATKEPGEPDHAGVPGGSSVWFSWTPTEAGRITVSACPIFEGPLEAVVAVYTGTAVNALAEVASSAGEPHLTCTDRGGEASFVAEAGTTYRIAVDGKNGSEGQFQLSLEGPTTNDAFAHAQPLAPEPSISNTGNTRRASKEPGEPDHAGDSTGHSVWFSWTAPSSGPIVLTACPYGEFDGDPVLAVYTGSAVDALTPVASDDGGGSYCNPGASQVEIDATAGTEYKIAVDATGGAGGIFSLGIEGTPKNDEFAAAQVLPGEPMVAGGSTRFATKQAGEPDHAGDPGGHSVWFSWTPSSSGPVAILACPGRTGGPYRTPGGIDALLGVYTGESLTGLTEVASDHGGPITETIDCEMEGMEGASEVHFDAVAGTTYKIAVDAAGGGEGPFTLAFERGAGNDDFGAARTLEGSLPLYGSVDNRFATKQAGEPDHAGDPGGHSVWFKWTPKTSGPVWIGTCTNSGHLDTLLGVYTGEAVNALTSVASDDDGHPLRPEYCRSTDSGVEVNAVAGTTYRIAIDGKGGTVGTTSLEIEGPPANDDFDHPYSLAATRSNFSLGSNRFATVQAGEPLHAGAAGGHSIWFKWTAPHDGEFTIDTCGSAIDTLLAVYTGGAVGSLTEVVSNDDAGGECSPASRVVFTATAGTVYRIAVDGKGGAVGTISLHLDEAPANDDFAAAEAFPPEGGYAPGASALATPQSGEPAPGGHSVWYSWTPNLSGPASLEACGTGFAPGIGIFIGSELTALSAVPTAAAGSGGCARGTAVGFAAVAGTTYRIEVGGAEGGRLQLHLVSAASKLRLLTVRTAGEGSGSVSSSAAGIACGSTCRYGLAAGTSLTLVAEPAPGSAFVGWSGGACAGAGTCVLPIHADATVTAMFGAAPADLPPAPHEEPPSSTDTGSNSPTPTIPPAPKQKSKPLRCRAGLKKVRVHGKVRCIKKVTSKPKRHRGHPQKHRG